MTILTSPDAAPFRPVPATTASKAAGAAALNGKPVARLDTRWLASSSLCDHDVLRALTALETVVKAS